VNVGSIPEPFALSRLILVTVEQTLFGEANVQAGCCGEVFTLTTEFASPTGAMTEFFAVLADNKSDFVNLTFLAVNDPIFSCGVGEFDEQIFSVFRRQLNRPLKLFFVF